MSVTPEEIRREFVRSRAGIAGTAILGALVIVSIVTVTAIPADRFEQWNNPGSWISYPKTAMPSWVNLFQAQKVPEHQIIDEYRLAEQDAGALLVKTIRYPIVFEYDQFPSDFVYSMQAEYSSSPLMQISVLRPDGLTLELFRAPLPHLDARQIHAERVFSTDSSIKKNLLLQSESFGFDISGLPAEEIVFSQSGAGMVLKGQYVFAVSILSQDETTVTESQLILGGKAFGMMGTDELRRDLAVGLLWGTPLALFIGLAVSIGSVSAGLVYGVYAGFKGRATDEAMMRLNDIVYALPALPFLIILAVTISSSIFVMIGFLMIFGWAGIAKVSRSMALQIKTRGYVDAARTMGQSNSRIVFRHILPQLLPYAFASIAISVPAAVTTEAGLSFLGLGDPSFPTWGQMLHDASTFGAAARGLWWWIVPPGIMIAVTGLAFVFIGNALDSIANPRLRRQDPM